MPHHPSLHFKKIDKYRSVRVGLHYRALAVEVPEGLLWFWIGSHSHYDKLLGELAPAVNVAHIAEVQLSFTG